MYNVWSLLLWRISSKVFFLQKKAYKSLSIVFGIYTTCKNVALHKLIFILLNERLLIAS